MHITSVRLNNFRSYDELVFDPSPGLNVIVGPNAAGKTNILEAIFLAALGRSHRTRKDVELINRKFHGAYVGIQLESKSGGRSIEIRLRDKEHKALKVDGQKLTRMGELMGVLNVVMFSPEDLSIVKNSPQERRRFMDMELCQLRPMYFYKLQQYNTALKQRLELLKFSYPDKPDEKLLSAWDERLSELGGDIMIVRDRFMLELGDLACEMHGRITDDNEELYTFYKPNVQFENTSSSQALRKALNDARENDLSRYITSRGPHRDDIGIKINGEEARIFGSQGQQRTAALSIKLSELELIRREKGELPVLLLDDVLSELDFDRQRALMSNAFACQCFLTTTSLEGLEDIPNMRVFECRNGELIRVSQ